MIIAACGGTNTGNSTGSQSGTQGTGGNHGAGGNGSATCMPGCVAPQFCSSAGTCLDPGKCAGDGDCPGGTVCDMTSTCVPGGGCASQAINADAIPPNMLVVLDRSCSMTEMVGGGMNKWQVAVAALNKLTTDYTTKIRFGLTLFPDLVTPNCGQDKIPIPVGPGNEMAIQTLLNASLKAADPYYPDGPCVTNIDTAVQQAATEPAFMDMTRDSYALLLTDGQQSGCNLAGGANGATKIIQMLAASKVPTFVIGFGTGVDANQLNAFADAGGVPSGDPKTHYYDAQDQASLDKALGTIASKTLSCSLKLQSVPPDPTKIFVFFNKDPKGVAQDPTHMNGWDYDPATNTITFYGADCASLKGGTVMSLDVVVGCPMLPPH